ncbi:MAG: hypothetical protein ACNA8W_12790, partial [Bradymonadaceae bacterium]
SQPPRSGIDHEGATQLFEIPPDSGGVQGGQAFGPPSHQGQHQAPYGQPAPGPQHGQPGQNQILVPSSDDGGFEGHTQFVNLNEFATQGTHFTPEQQAAGYDGSTQFVDVNALMAGDDPAAAQGGDIENDALLRQSYAFGPESIQRGEEITLIFAQNALGKPVILKRIWEGSAEQMSTPLRQRVAHLYELRHPCLLPMNGMLVTHSGLWVELERPHGVRLTQLLQQQGPQEPHDVLGWMQTTAEILEIVHAHQVAYANLTTDALWIQEDGSVRVEPFDMLRFEDRGNLGNFGPQEMHRPLEQRNLSPSTDVYCLAAVTLACLTGLPLDLNRVAQLDKKMASAIGKALVPNPAERPQSAVAFVQSLPRSKKSTPKGESKGGLPDLDIKVIGIIAAVVLLAFGGYMYWEQEQAKEAHAQRVIAQQLAAEQAEALAAQEEATARANKLAQKDGPEAQEDMAPVTQPGTVENDSRLKVRTSFALNPPDDVTANATPAQLEAWRETARKAIPEGDKLRGNDAWEQYHEGLRAITRVIRLQDVPTDDDQQILKDLYSKSIVKKEHEVLRNRIETLVKEGSLGTASRSYQRLASIDPSANAGDFFTSHSTANVHVVERTAKD